MYCKPFHDLQLSALGLGSLHLPAHPGEPNHIHRAQAQAVLDAAMDRGVNYIDTALTYHEGDSERFLGEALSRYRRDSYCLATKFYAAPGRQIETCFEEQLRRCRTDYFDIYLLHSVDEIRFPLYTGENAGYLEFLLRQKELGRIRYLGFSSHAAPALLRQFLDWYDGFDMALIQLNYLDWTLLDARGQYEILKERNIPIWVMEPLKGGRLSRLNDRAAAILRQAAPDRSLASWGFRFLMGLEQVQVVLSGMASVEVVEENCATFQRPDPLSEGERAVLDQAARAYLETMGAPCSACRYCCPGCPAELDIPLLIRGYNERQVVGSTWRVQTFGAAKSAADCLQCGACLAKCPQKIDIPKIMAALAAAESRQ